MSIYQEIRRVWIATAPTGVWNAGPAVVSSEAEVAAWREMGWEVSGPYTKDDTPMPQIDLAEFVSDYVQMLRESGEGMPRRDSLAAEIADAYLERTGAAPDERPTKNLLADIDYYLPER